MSAPIYTGGRPFYKGGVRYKNYVEFNKTIVNIADGVAKTIFTVNVPNPAVATSFASSLVFVTIFQILGAGGGVGAGEAVSSAMFTVQMTRTSGLAAVIAVSGAINAASSTAVAGGDTSAAVTLTNVAVAGANTVAQTFAMQSTPHDSSGSSTNHTLIVSVECMNAGLGVTFS